MADRRYRNGIFQGNSPPKCKTGLDNPTKYGWTFAYRNTQYNRPIYTLSTFKMMPHPHACGWLVENTLTNQQHHYTGPLGQITANVKSQIPTNGLNKDKPNPPPTTSAPAAVTMWD